MSRACGYFALILCFAFTVAAAQSGAPSPAEGGITGTVLTENGQIAANVTVCTSVHRKSQWGEETTDNCRVKADAQGRFTIEHLPLGKYRLFAINEAEGYSIDNQAPGLAVAITEEQPWQIANIQLHDRGAVITAVITDSQTHKVLQDAFLSYEAIDCGATGSSLNYSEKIYLVVPPNCDLVVIARAKRHKGWIYTDAANPSRPVLRLLTGERKPLDIQLEPFPEQSASK
jgi:hypothetical protein